jgi:Mrp family chromosome partitioning ATPase/capsular polysaccharide biosynthesis protein
MSNPKTDPPNSGITLGDIYYVLFRRKWLILGFSLAGVLAALSVCFTIPPQYRSEAELALALYEPSGDTINTEIQILQSLDLAQLAVQALTPAAILAGAGGGTDTNAAAFFVKKSLKVEAVPGSSVIHVTFQHPDKEIVRPTLSKIIDGYLIKHFRMWSGGGLSANTLTADSARLAANVNIIQLPTPPVRSWPKKTVKTVVGLAVGGMLAGLTLAFLLELILDRSVKRPSEIVTKLRLPLFISIPEAQKNGHQRRTRPMSGGRSGLHHAAGNGTGGKASPGMGMAPWDHEHPLREFYEGLRDRLVVYFQARNMVRKPKLLAVTSCGSGAGVSSIATGLAATLSETGDGNVLLVNISGDQGAAQEFRQGEPGDNLDEVLETRKKCALVKANLYTITGQANGDLLPANLPNKLSALMPKLVASEYNYIIFDMPPVNRTSVTARLSGFMDMVLLVIESEKTNQDVVKDVILLLAESNHAIGTVLNKSRNYVPARLHQECLHPV